MGEFLGISSFELTPGSQLSAAGDPRARYAAVGGSAGSE